MSKKLVLLLVNQKMYKQQDVLDILVRCDDNYTPSIYSKSIVLHRNEGLVYKKDFKKDVNRGIHKRWISIRCTFAINITI